MCGGTLRELIDARAERDRQRRDLDAALGEFRAYWKAA